jgi:ketosteroid isomerase-like protein
MTMSQERAPIIQGLLQAAFDSIARQQIEGVLDGYEPDVEFSLVGFQGIGLAERYSGHEGWLEWAADIFEIWADPVWTVKRVLDGGDRFVAEIDLEARGKASGAEVTMTWGAVYYLTPSGKIARQDSFRQDGWKLALEAAGLSE